MDNTSLQPGFDKLMKHLHTKQIKRGLLTLNSHVAVNHLFDNPQEHFSVVLTRDFKDGFKPSPAPLQHICKTWGLSPHECLMVGDAPDDLLAAKRADIASVLVVNSENDQLKDDATHHIHTLDQLIDIVEHSHSHNQ
jgi:HAD superfamily hydrolase (TIGR01549 family)